MENINNGKIMSLIIDKTKNAIQSIKDTWTNSLTDQQKLVITVTLAIFAVISWIAISLKLYKYAKLNQTLKDKKVNNVFKSINDKESVPRKIPPRYEGNFKNGDGNGKIILGDGTVFEGTFKNSLLEGEGSINYPTGITYKGIFQEGELNGEGKVILQVGTEQDVIEGQFKNNLLHGVGSKKFANGAYEEGTYYEGNLDEWCTVRYVGMDEFKGYFDRGVLVNGNGRQVHPNGDIYEGNIVQKLLQGEGKAILNNNSEIHEGFFINGQLDGDGKKTVHGDVYKGNFFEGKLKGQGEIILPNGKIEGIFENDLLEGQGKVTKGQIIFQGEFKQGNFIKGTVHQYGNLIKEGTFLPCNPAKEYPMLVEGQMGQEKGIFKNERLINGKITIPGGAYKDGTFDDNGYLIKGKWLHRGDLYEGDFHGFYLAKGTKTLADGTVLEGTFIDDKLHGEGEIRYPDNRISKGTFEREQLIKGTGTIPYNFNFLGFSFNGTYTGEIGNQIPQGKGIFSNDDGIHFEGEFQGSSFSGYAKWKGSIYSYPNNHYSYDGYIKNNLKDGQGLYIDTLNKKRFDGNFEDDQFISGTMYVGLTKYTGVFVNEKLKNGQIVHPTGYSETVANFLVVY